MRNYTLLSSLLLVVLLFSSSPSSDALRFRGKDVAVDEGGVVGVSVDQSMDNAPPSVSTQVTYSPPPIPGCAPGSNMVCGDGFMCCVLESVQSSWCCLDSYECGSIHGACVRSEDHEVSSYSTNQEDEDVVLKSSGNVSGDDHHHHHNHHHHHHHHHDESRGNDGDDDYENDWDKNEEIDYTDNHGNHYHFSNTREHHPHPNVPTIPSNNETQSSQPTNRRRRRHHHHHHHRHHDHHHHNESAPNEVTVKGHDTSGHVVYNISSYP